MGEAKTIWNGIGCRTKKLTWSAYCLEHIFCLFYLLCEMFTENGLGFSFFYATLCCTLSGNFIFGVFNYVCMYICMQYIHKIRIPNNALVFQWTENQNITIKYFLYFIRNIFLFFEMLQLRLCKLLSAKISQSFSNKPNGKYT